VPESGIAKTVILNLLAEHMLLRNKMAEYKCFKCGKTVKGEHVKKRVRCPYCGSKILFKPRTSNIKVKAE